MRKPTLAGLCFLLSLIIVYGLNYAAGSYGFGFDGPVSLALGSLILAPILLIPLTRLNRSLLAWRKRRGRDIEEEEKYEIGDSDIISLRPRQSDDGKPL